MQYVDGFVLPVPKKNLKAYKALAKLACKVWLDHGALDYRECVAEDVKPGKLTSFPQSVKLKAGETVVFSWITYRSRKHRDAVMAKVMKDPRLAKMMDPKKMPFDAKRMFFGGFDTIVTAQSRNHGSGPPDDREPVSTTSCSLLSNQQDIPMTSITPFLWFDNNVPEAVAFYKSVFPNAKVETVNDFMATFELEGQKFNALNGGPRFKFNEAISFFVSVESQEEVDYFWNKLTADGGEESKCGWLKDKFGLSWQIVPTALGELMKGGTPAQSQKVMEAMMKMVKLDIKTLKQAYEQAA